TCGSALWLYDPQWPELIHPFASAIDTELPVPPEHTHLMLGSKASWVEVQLAPADQQLDEYPQEWLAEGHGRLGVDRAERATAGSMHHQSFHPSQQRRGQQLGAG